MLNVGLSIFYQFSQTTDMLIWYIRLLIYSKHTEKDMEETGETILSCNTA